MAETAFLPMTVLDADVASHPGLCVLSLRSHVMLSHQQAVLGCTFAHA